MAAQSRVTRTDTALWAEPKAYVLIYDETLQSDAYAFAQGLDVEVLRMHAGQIDTATLVDTVAHYGSMRRASIVPGDDQDNQDAMAFRGEQSHVGRLVRIDVPAFRSREVTLGATPPEHTVSIDASETADPVSPWFGYILGRDRDRAADDVAARSARVGYQAVGLEWFLGRVQIDASYVQTNPDTEAVIQGNKPYIRRIARAIPFNAPDTGRTGFDDGQSQRGNRAANGTLAFRSAERLSDRPRATGKAGGTFGKYSTPDQTAYIQASIENATVQTPADYVGPPPAVPTVCDLFGDERGFKIAAQEGRFETTIVRAVFAESFVFQEERWIADWTAAEKWNGWQMIEYLLKYFSPAKKDGTPMPYRWRLASGHAVLDVITPTVRTDRRTVLEVINEICSPRRGLGWYLEVQTTADETFSTDQAEWWINLHVFSLASTGNPVPDGRSFPPNAFPVEIHSDSDPTAAVQRLSESFERRYDRVVVRGARATSTFTVSVGDGTLQRDWSDEAEREYREGASTDDDYPATLAAQRLANDARRRELGREGVFSAFRVPDDWDALTADGDPASDREPAFPVLSENGSVLGSHEIFLAMMRPERRTRLPAAAPSDAGDSFETAFAVLQVDGEWGFAHALTDHTATQASRLASYRLSAVDGSLAVRLLSSKGLNHTLAGDEWQTPRPLPAGADPLPEGAPSRLAGEADYRTLRVTMAAQGDLYCEGVYEADDVPERRSYDTLTIDAGEEYRLDFLAEGTITGIQENQLVTAPVGRVLRDDRGDLRLLAAAAWAWYSVPRTVLELQYSRIYPRLALGMMISTLGKRLGDPGPITAPPEPINTAIGSITHVFGATQQTTIRTIDASVPPTVDVVVTEGRA